MRATAANGTGAPVPGIDLKLAGLSQGMTAVVTQVSAAVWTVRLDAALNAPRFVTTYLTLTGKLGTFTRTTQVVVTVL